MERRARNEKVLQMNEDDADAAHKALVSATRFDSATLNGPPACPPSHTKLETLTKAMVDELRRNVVVAKGAKGSDSGLDGGHDVASGHTSERYVLDCAPFWYLCFGFPAEDRLLIFSFLSSLSPPPSLGWKPAVCTAFPEHHCLCQSMMAQFLAGWIGVAVLAVAMQAAVIRNLHAHEKG